MDHTERACPVVAVLKPYGKKILGRNYALTINKYTTTITCPMPTIDYVIGNIGDARVFSRINLQRDFSNICTYLMAYLQLVRFFNLLFRKTHDEHLDVLDKVFTALNDSVFKEIMINVNISLKVLKIWDPCYPTRGRTKYSKNYGNRRGPLSLKR